MHIFISDLYEDATCLCEEFAGDDQAVSEIGEIGMDTKLPGVPEGPYLLGLASGVFGLAISHITLAGGDLPVGPELDPVGRVHIDHLNFAFEAFFFSQGGHYKERVAEDHSVGPVLLMTVEVDEFLESNTIEICEKRDLQWL
jgi:hypothetical protein